MWETLAIPLYVLAFSVAMTLCFDVPDWISRKLKSKPRPRKLEARISQLETRIAELERQLTSKAK